MDTVTFFATEWDYEMNTEGACIAQCDGEDMCIDICLDIFNS